MYELNAYYYGKKISNHGKSPEMKTLIRKGIALEESAKEGWEIRLEWIEA